MPLKHSVEEIILKNGARGLLVNTPGMTSVYYNVRFIAGTLYAPQEKSQTAHIMEHMAFGATERFPSIDAFSIEFSKNGAYNNAMTSNIDLEYYSHAAIMEWDRILQLQLDAISRPLYTEEYLESEKGNVTEELTGYGASHQRILWQEARKALGLRRWYDPDELKSISGVSLSDITEHFKKTHTTDNMRFIIGGDLAQHKNKITEMLEALPLPRGEQLEVPTDSVSSSAPVFITRKDLPSLNFQLIFVIKRPLTFKEEYALSALNHILTGTHHSKILGEARKRGICYGMWSDYDSSPLGVSEFSMGGQVSFANAGELFELIVEKINDVREHGISAEELAQAKSYRVGRLQMQYDSAGEIASWYENDYYNRLEIEDLNTSEERVKQITPEELSAILEEFIRDGEWVLAGIGNGDEKEFEAHYDLFAKKLANRTVQ